MWSHSMLSRMFLEERGLVGRLTTGFLKKKWENLKQKYKDLKNPPTGVSTEGGEATAASWKWFNLMHEAIGDRPSVTPPVLISTTAQGAVVFTPPLLLTPTRASTVSKRRRVDIVEVLHQFRGQDEQEWRRLQEEEREREERREAERARQAAEREERWSRQMERLHQEAAAREERWREEMRARDDRRDREAAARDERLLAILERFAEK
ncbi:hypothetical protein ACEWY4_010148 [Coilia grayii]|uniref:Uncharacterized protein n=1 Tax=Coilia grayii TaxID=363190 RepID=A0ABD1K8E9_9TELE